MNIHEYQAKIILQKYGIPTPEFYIVTDELQIEEAIAALGEEQAVVKVQVHAGGRGKAGGVKIAKNSDEIKMHARNMLNMRFVNNQTGKEGIAVRQVLISPLSQFTKEFYVGATIDRKKAQAVLILSPEGGMDIEEIAAKNPEKILTIPILLSGRIRNYHHVQIAKFMGWKGETARQAKQIISGLAKAFIETDASLLEINPLVETTEGDLLALDAKLSIDDNAVYRQPLIAEFYDPAQINPLEARAKEYDLAYVAMDGEIGCMVNGAGLAMATMDIIHYFGGAPANFLDVGGSATQEKIAEGFKIILSDPKVKAILINIFGGIMNCATIASAVVEVTKELKVSIPLVLRMEGTNVEKGKRIIAESGIPIEVADDLSDAAKKVVTVAKQKRD